MFRGVECVVKVEHLHCIQRSWVQAQAQAKTPVDCSWRDAGHLLLALPIFQEIQIFIHHLLIFKFGQLNKIYREKASLAKNLCHLKLTIGPSALDSKTIKTSHKIPYIGNILQYSVLSTQNTFLILLSLLNHFSLEIFLAPIQAELITLIWTP